MPAFLSASRNLEICYFWSYAEEFAAQSSKHSSREGRDCSDSEKRYGRRKSKEESVSQGSIHLVRRESMNPSRWTARMRAALGTLILSKTILVPRTIGRFVQRIRSDHGSSAKSFGRSEINRLIKRRRLRAIRFAEIKQLRVRVVAGRAEVTRGDASVFTFGDEKDYESD